jgi:hypothetical protein
MGDIKLEKKSRIQEHVSLMKESNVSLELKDILQAEINYGAKQTNKEIIKIFYQAVDIYINDIVKSVLKVSEKTP